MVNKPLESVKPLESDNKMSAHVRGHPEMSPSKYGHFQIYIPTYLIIFRRYGLKLHVKFSHPYHFENLHTYPCEELISGRPLNKKSDDPNKHKMARKRF